MYKSGDEIGGTFPVVDPATGGLAAADDTPTAMLTINGVDSAAVVTVSTTGITGRYAWSVTLPAGITDGKALALWVEAEVGGVAGGNNVWQGVGCSARSAEVLDVVENESSGNAAIAATIAALPTPGDATESKQNEILEAIGDIVPGATAADVWANSERTLTTPAQIPDDETSVATITRRRGDSWSVSLTGLGSLASRAHLWATVKRNYGDRDSAAVLSLSEESGEITVDDEAAGNITIRLDAETTAAIGPRTYVYDIQILRDDDSVATLAEGQWIVLADVTRATAPPDEED